MPMNVPVRPIPALQCTAQGCATWSSHQSRHSSSIFMIGSGLSGTPWSGQVLYQKCRISRSFPASSSRSAVPLPSFHPLAVQLGCQGACLAVRKCCVLRDAGPQNVLLKTSCSWCFFVGLGLFEKWCFLLISLPFSWEGHTRWEAN